MADLKRDIIVVGASTGGVEALQLLLSTVPAGIPASIFIVQHISPWSRSALPEILSRSCGMPVVHALNCEPFLQGHVYVAPPDHHLVLEERQMILWRGPKENRFRPAVNVLFRSAATEHRARVTGVVLSGALDDGAAGLWWIARNGGAALVQDPQEAPVGDMPRNALEYVDSALVFSVRKMGRVLYALAVGEELDRCEQKRA